MLLWQSSDTEWQLVNNGKLAAALKERRGVGQPPDTRIFIAFYTVDESSGAPPYETDPGGNYVFYDIFEGGCSVWYSSEPKTNPASLRDWEYFAGATLAAYEVAFSVVGILYAKVSSAFLTSTTVAVAKAAAESGSVGKIDPLLEGLVNNPAAKGSIKQAHDILGNRFRDGNQVYRYFRSKAYLKRLYRFVAGQQLSGHDLYEPAVIVPFGSPIKSPSRVFMQSFAGFQPGTILSFRELDQLRATAGVALSTFSSLAIGDLNPAGFVINNTAAEIIKGVQTRARAVRERAKQTLEVDEAAPDSISNKVYRETWSAIRPILDSAVNILELVGNSTENRLVDFELSTVVGKDGAEPSPFLPEQVRRYLSKISTEPVAYGKAVEDALGSTTVGTGCKILGMVAFGKPLPCAAYGDIYTASRFVDQCVDADAISRAVDESAKSDRMFNSAVISTEALKDNVMLLAFDKTTGRGNLEWLLGTTVAYVAKEFESANPRALKDVTTQDWFIQLRRWVTGGSSPMDRRPSDVAYLWAFRNLIMPLLDPFSTERGVLKRQCNKLSEMVHTFAQSQQATFNRRLGELVQLCHVETITLEQEQAEVMWINAKRAAKVGSIFYSTFILPHIPPAVTRWKILESSFMAECRLRVLAHYYPLLPLHCMLRSARVKAGNAIANAARSGIAEAPTTTSLWSRITGQRQDDATTADGPADQPYLDRVFDYADNAADLDRSLDTSPPEATSLWSRITSVFGKNDEPDAFEGEEEVVEVGYGMTEAQWNERFGRPGFLFSDAKRKRHSNNQLRLRQMGY